MTGTLTGKHQELNGTAASGTVTVIPSAPVIKDTTGVVLLSGVLRQALDSTGSYSVTVPGYDQAGVDPQGVTYTVLVELSSGPLDPVVGVRVDDGQTVSVVTATPVSPGETYAEQVTRAEFDALAATVPDGLQQSAKVTTSGTYTITSGMLPSTRTVTLSGNLTVALGSSPSSGISGVVSLVLVQGAGAYTVTWPSTGTLPWLGGVLAPTLSLVAGQRQLVHLLWTGVGWVGINGGTLS